MNKLDLDYQALLQDILDNGIEKQDRTGTGTLSVFGRTIRHDMKTGFPALTTKKLYFKGVVTELLWFLRGDTNIKYLVNNGCHIWDGDCYANYLVKTKNQIEDPNDLNWDLSSPKDPKITQLTQEQFINKIKTDDEFAKKWGELGPIYGKQWRNWDIKPNIETKSYIHKGETHFTFDINERQPIDQIANLINDLKTNPDSRRLLVSAWNPAELDQMVLPPCHYGFQVYTRELSLEERRSLVSQEMFNQIYNGGGPETLSHSEINQWNIPTRAISLMYNARSQDVPLGTPFNIASYALLLEIIAKEVNMIPDELIANMGDCHIYLNQIEGVKEQLTRESYPLPKLKILDSKVDDIAHYEIGDFIIEGYQSHPAIKIPLSN